MEQSLRETLGEEFSAKYIQSLQWKNLYADNSDGYRFRNMDITKIPYAVSEVSDLYRFVLKNDTYTNEEEVAQTLKAVIARFDEKNISLEKIVFQLNLGKDTVLLTTDAYTVRNETEENLTALLIHIAAAQATDSVVKVVHSENLKEAHYFLNDENETPHDEAEESEEYTETSGTEQQTENK